jgi:two-component system repressor protein LuxO
MASARAVTAPIDVLIVDADPTQRRALAGLIADRALGRYAARMCETPDEALAAARDGTIVIADVETVGGVAHFAEFTRGATPLIATSARGSLNAAVAAVRAGAVDFLAKPIGAGQLMERLEAAVSTWRGPTPEPAPATSQPRRGEPAADPADGFAGFVGTSAPMQAVYAQIRQIARSRAPVFITGESGTGKELCAAAVHEHAGPGGRPFVAINCSAIPRDLMESEIFGHVRGAFTGATADRAGAAELADGGTLFLDEIAEMDLGLQAKLLRFLQSGTVRRVGGSEETKVEVRVICATNREPHAEVHAGRFRTDLFYRLHVLPIHLPPLRDRREDILPIAGTFLARFAAEEGKRFRGFDEVVAARLAADPWPGNVRQLQNLVRRVVVLHDGDTVSEAMLPAAILRDERAEGPLPSPRIAPFHEQERRIIESALAACGGNIARAAAALELSPSTIYRKRETWSKRA